jgi:hypothetical protein
MRDALSKLMQSGHVLRVGDYYQLNDMANEQAHFATLKKRACALMLAIDAECRRIIAEEAMKAC